MPKKKAEKVTTIETAPGIVVTIGDTVRFYRNGWRCGQLEDIKGPAAIIRPIGPKGKRFVTVPVTDVEKI